MGKQGSGKGAAKAAGRLAGIRERPFFEQVMELSRIDKEKPAELIPELFELLNDPLPDPALANMVEDVLRGMLADREQEVAERLAAGVPGERRFLFEVVKRYRFAAAVVPLQKLLAQEKTAAGEYEVLLTLAEIPAARALPLFRERIGHNDPLISALAIETLGTELDAAVLPKLFRIVESNEDLDRYHDCAIQTAEAIEALGRARSKESIEFLAAKIHHRNPTARQLVHEALTAIGAEAVAALAAAFDGGDTDMKIMAANVLGAIGDRRGGEAMLAALDRGAAEDANVRFAVYEAFGKIRFMKGLVCLLDALDEPDEMIRLAVVGGLEAQVNAAVVEKVRAKLGAEPEAARQLARSIGAARAVNLFAALYADAAAGSLLVAAVAGSGDAEQAAVFVAALQRLGAAARPGDLQTLQAVAAHVGGPRILAVDDSKSMILFYRSVAAAAKLEIITAGNGKEALALLERGERVDLVVSDLNMPEMNGIELVKQLRTRPGLAQLPVLMVTTESESHQVQLAEKAGVNAFLRKPFAPPALQEKIAALLAARPRN